LKTAALTFKIQDFYWDIFQLVDPVSTTKVYKCYKLTKFIFLQLETTTPSRSKNMTNLPGYLNVISVIISSKQINFFLTFEDFGDIQDESAYFRTLKDKLQISGIT